MSRLKHSIIWSSILSGAILIGGIYAGINTANLTTFLLFLGGAIMAYTLLSCLILGDNFLGELILDVWSFGFVKFPMIIFTLDLDGIIWLLTVKLLFWILGFILALGFGIFAILLGGVLSLFVYPFVLRKHLKGSVD